MKKHIASFSGPGAACRGFSLVELMVAMAVAGFLLIGLFTVLQNTHNASDNERLLAQLQDSQRISMSLLTSTIESTGYYSNAVTVAQTTALAAAANFAQDGQSISGGTDANGNDFFFARFQTDGTDGMLSCLGPSTAAGIYDTEFSLVADPTTDPVYAGTYQLACSVKGGPNVNLVRGLTKMEISYGTGTTLAAANSAGSADSYLTAAQMAANPLYWTNVFSVRVVLTFKNPMASQPGQATKQLIKFGRVINIKSRAGINVVNYT